MAVYHDCFQIQSDRRPTFHDVTEQVQQALAKSGIQDGILLVFSQHTTCSVLIQEASDDVNYWGTELLMQDLRPVPPPWPEAYRGCRRAGRAAVLVPQYGCAPEKRHHGKIPIHPSDGWHHDPGRIWAHLFRGF
jgi:hypothetical protein